ncbi:MAG: ABC transporter permease [Candidatus Hydrothermarchaeales archaeon]
MKTLFLMKHELSGILSNKKFMAGFVLQLLLLLAIVPTFSNFLATGDIKTAVPTMKGFVPIGVVDNSPDNPVIVEALTNNEKLEIKYFNTFPSENLQRGEISSVLMISEDYNERSNNQLSVSLVIDRANLKRESVFDAISKSVGDASSRIRRMRESELSGAVLEPIKLKKELLNPVMIEKKEGRFSSFFLGYLIPLVLFFPIFTSGNLIVDIVVGEKERKTLESLLTSPIDAKDITSAKFGAIFIFISIQTVLWLALLRLQKIPIANLGSVLAVLLSVNAAVIITAILLGVYSITVKEANISMMLLYVVLFVGLIVSLSMEYFNPVAAFEILPFINISRLVVGKSINPLTTLFLILSLALYTFIVLLISIKLLERDDVVFGPRPALFDLMNDFTEGVLTRMEHTSFGISVLSFGFAGFAVIFSFTLEVALGMLIFFSFGFSFFTLYLITMLFALIEEFLKPLALYSVAVNRPGAIGAEGGFFYGALAGIGFFFFENFFLAIIVALTLPSRVIQILTLRIGTILFIHAISSGIVGLGISRLTKGENLTYLFYLLTAAAIHAGYNLLLVIR